MSYLSTIVEDNDTNITGLRQADSEGYNLKTVRGNSYAGQGDQPARFRVLNRLPGYLQAKRVLGAP